MSDGMVDGGGVGDAGSAAGSSPAAAPSAPVAGSTTAGKTTATVPSGSPKATATVSKPGTNTSVTNSKFADAPDASTAAPVGETSAEKAERIARKLKLKIDGGEEEVDLDKWVSRSDAEVARDIQMARAAQKRMSEAAQQRRQAEEVLNLFKNDPFAAAQYLGMDLETLAEQRLAEKFREATLPEHERKALELQRQLEARENELTQIREAEQARVQAEMDREVFESTERDFKKALELTGLPQSNETLYMMAEIASLSLQHGIELTPEQMATEVRERLSEQSKFVFSKMRGTDLLSYLGEDVVKEVMRARLAQIRKPTPAPAPPPPTPGKVTMVRSEDLEDPKPQHKPVSSRSFRRSLL